MAYASDDNRYDYVIISVCNKPAIVFATDKKEGRVVLGDVRYLVTDKASFDLVLRAQKYSKNRGHIKADKAVNHTCSQSI